METLKHSLIIRKGVFYKNGQAVKPAHGDIEQISCLRKYEKLKEGIQVLNSGIDIEEGVITAYIKCACGKLVFFETECDNPEFTDIIGNYSDLIDEYAICPTCKQEYYLSMNDDNELIAKIK